MASIVGSKGQVVIPKGIREQLGVEPGWIALQRVVGAHVEVHFVPPEHNKSLKGALAVYLKDHITGEQEWDEARHTAWSQATKERLAEGKPTL